MDLSVGGRDFRMRVLYFSEHTSGHNQRFLKKLSQAGIEVWFLDPTSEHLPEGWLPKGIHWVQAKQKLLRDADPDSLMRFLPELQDLLRKIRPDLVHAGPTQSCGYLCALTETHPWLLMSWGSDILFHAERNPNWKRATQIALSSADGFFFDCDAVRTRAKQMADVPDSRIVQFPWGIETQVFSPTGELPAAKDFVREAGTHVFLSTRSWEPIYGTGVLLEAFRQASGKNSSLRLLMLGRGPEARHVRQFIDSHELNGVIATPGCIDEREMPKWFRIADTYVSCSHSDGTSISLLEAMASGLPVVVTDIASNREWVTEGQNGWLATSGATEQFCEKLLKAAALSQEERALISQCNRQIVEERADWDRNFPQLLAMYENLMSVSARL